MGDLGHVRRPETNYGQGNSERTKSTWATASTAPSEDFADTFHFYLRHKGRLPLRLTGRSILIRKWRYIDRIARRMALGRENF